MTIHTHPLFERVSHFIKTENLFSGIQHVDVALSGGADSVCLLAILSTIPRNFSLRAHHIQHGFRPDDAHDADIARKITEHFQVEFIHSRLTWPNGIPQNDIENQARDARYRALYQALEGYDHAALALAHHGDENLETSLWRLGRGCGLEGLSLASRRTHSDLTMIRPLLAVSKDDIYKFLRDENLEWAEDPTNQSDHYRRNRIRHHVLPALKSEAMNEQCLFRSLTLIRHDADALDNFANNFAKQYQGLNADWYCPWDAWKTLNTDAQSQVLRHAARLVLPGHCPSSQFIESALSCIENRAQTHRQVENGFIHVGWFRGGILIWSNAQRPEIPVIPLNIPCSNLKIHELCTLSAWRMTPDSPLKNSTNLLHLDASCARNLSIHPASHFQTITTTQHKTCKISQALQNSMIPDRWQTQWPVLCADNRPLWIFGGMRTPDATPAIPQTLAISLMIHWNPTYILPQTLHIF